MPDETPPMLDYADPRPPQDESAAAEESLTLGYAIGLVLLPGVVMLLRAVSTSLAVWGFDTHIRVLVLDVIAAGCAFILIQRFRGKRVARDVKNGIALVFATTWFVLCV